PSLLICSDFMSECYHASRTTFVSATVTEAQAAKSLQLVWVASNDDLCVQWHQQVVEDERLHAEQERLAKEEAIRLQQILQLEEDAARAEEKKKNRFKHTDLLMQPRPIANEDDTLVSYFALRKIDKGVFVELYYWTNNNLEDALVSYSTRDDDGMIPTEQHGSMVWISVAASTPSKHVVPDHFLLPADFTQAIPHIVAALEEHDWPKQCVLMLVHFWGAIMTHLYWNSNDLVAQRALMTYQ
ncbi:hypothetical protein EV702DRAFT_944044, partial [Suillus placidus]